MQFKSDLLVFFRFIPVFTLSSIVMYWIGFQEFWEIKSWLRLILAIPLLFIFYYTIQLFDLIYFAFSYKKWKILSLVKSQPVSNLEGFDIISINRCFYLVEKSGKRKILSKLVSHFLSKSIYVYTYRTSLNKKFVTFDLLRTIGLFVKTIALIFIWLYIKHFIQLIP